nr:hypothetical protein [Virgisporangium ochraceum]
MRTRPVWWASAPITVSVSCPKPWVSQTLAIPSASADRSSSAVSPIRSMWLKIP